MSLLNPILLLNEYQKMVFDSIFKTDEDLIGTDENLMHEELKERVAKFLLQFETEKDIINLLLDINESNLNLIDYIKNYINENSIAIMEKPKSGIDL